MLVRGAALSDLPALLDVQQAGAVRGLAHIFRQDRYPFPRAEVHARWEAELADPAIGAYVIEDDAGRIAGFAAIRGDELLHFGTAVESWGRGLASAAHDELLGRFTAAGVTRARLRVFEENHRARRFYEKLGWRPSGRLSRTSFAPHPVLVEYELDLPSERHP
ncbi:MAG: GNAT family N-acetyltransferase [Actinomycetota bacterium]|nr:GNAT family N-acetyltransferase [Actinomycetota bacterium]